MTPHNVIGVALRVVRVLLCAGVAVGCRARRERTRASVVSAATFYDAIVPTLIDTLRASPADSDTFIVGGLVTESSIYLLDDRQSVIRVYSRAGRFIRVIGGPGDGPGQFRHPFAIQSTDSSAFVVLDQGRHVLAFHNSDGRLLREVKIPAGYYGSMLVNPRENRILLIGRMTGQHGAPDADTYELDYDGRVLRAFGHAQPTHSNWESKFATEFGTRVGSAVVIGALNSVQLRFEDSSGTTQKVIALGPRWVHLDWPPDKLLENGATNQTVATRVTAWAHQQTLMNGVYAVRGGRLVVRFQGYAPGGHRVFYYVVADTTGRLLSRTHGTKANLISARGDTVFWVETVGRQLIVGSGLPCDSATCSSDGHSSGPTVTNRTIP